MLPSPQAFLVIFWTFPPRRPHHRRRRMNPSRPILSPHLSRQQPYQAGGQRSCQPRQCSGHVVLPPFPRGCLAQGARCTLLTLCQALPQCPSTNLGWPPGVRCVGGCLQRPLVLLLASNGSHSRPRSALLLSKCTLSCGTRPPVTFRTHFWFGPASFVRVHGLVVAKSAHPVGRPL